MKVIYARDRDGSGFFRVWIIQGICDCQLGYAIIGLNVKFLTYLNTNEKSWIAILVRHSSYFWSLIIFRHCHLLMGQNSKYALILNKETNIKESNNIGYLRMKAGKIFINYKRRMQAVQKKEGINVWFSFRKWIHLFVTTSLPRTARY